MKTRVTLAVRLALESPFQQMWVQVRGFMAANTRMCDSGYLDLWLRIHGCVDVDTWMCGCEYTDVWAWILGYVACILGCVACILGCVGDSTHGCLDDVAAALVHLRPSVQ